MLEGLRCGHYGTEDRQTSKKSCFALGTRVDYRYINQDMRAVGSIHFVLDFKLSLVERLRVPSEHMKAQQGQDTGCAACHEELACRVNGESSRQQKITTSYA